MAGLNGFPLSDRIMVANLKLPTLGFLRLQAQEDVNQPPHGQCRSEEPTDDTHGSTHR
jgi:hypothetical protein